jgi:apolipoprotein N-acyltransferase
VLAFPPIDLLPAVFVGLVPIFWVLKRTRPTGFWSAFRPGLIAGVAFFGPLLYWLVNLSSLDMDNPVLMSGPLVLLVLLEAVFWGLFSAGAYWVSLRTRVPAWVSFPILWVACEQVRSLGVLGFTWGALGYAGVAVPRAIQFASITGLYGVSLWIALANALVVEVIVSPRARRLGAAAWLAALLAAPVIHGSIVLARAPAWPTVRVAVVQPNIDAKKKWDAQFKDESFRVLRELSLEAASARPDLIVWPETAAPSYLLRQPLDMEKVAAVAREAGTSLLTGFPDLREDAGVPRGFRTFNSAILVTPDGVPMEKYDKIHLVPFGEFIPFETVFPALRNVDFGEADFSPGTERVVFDAGPVKPSVLVCFESIFPRLVREFVANGANLLVNITNDVWYGRTSMPFQHASMAVMRSIENRRSLARSANSGVSLLADPYGRITARLGIFERGILVNDVPLVSERTFYTAHGDLVGWGATCLAGLLIVLSFSQGRPSSRTARERRS